MRQRDVGEAVGVSADAIYAIEKGKQLASVGLLVGLADYFGVSIDYLVGRTDVKEMNV